MITKVTHQPSDSELSEFALISGLFAPLATGAEALGLTDDGAVIPPRQGQDMVVTTDALVAGVHFRPQDSAATAAARSLNTNLSDLAAMGADAFCYSLALALPGDWTVDWATEFTDRLGELQRQFGVFLLGGDTVGTPGPLTIGITAMGFVPSGQALRRNGAASGDIIWVSGTIGDAALGLALLSEEMSCEDKESRSYLISRFETPTPRLDLGRSLRGLAHSAIDISDGLLADLAHITDSSSAGADINLDRIPLSPAAQTIARDNPAILLSVLSGGDDYELLFTAPDAQTREILTRADSSKTPVTDIGRVTDSNVVRVLDSTKSPIEVGNTGFQHFAPKY